ncbi:MAG TPA: ABC transporter permease [Gemmatimonadaceae bacterium]|nr:ABC transporter permease [Gemmatimonadaceae bacterium]
MSSSPGLPPRSWSRAAERTFSHCLGLVRCIAPIVPAARRSAWVAEWTGELWYRLASLDRAGTLDARACASVLARTLGTLPHALWIRCADWSIDMLMHDLRYAVRVNAKRPAFSLLVIAILAVGIGATSAMFSIVNSVVLEPLPYPQASRLVRASNANRYGNQGAISRGDFLDYQSRNQVFSSFAAYTFFGSAVLSGTAEPERVTAPMVTANFFSTLGVQPVLGRAFSPQEEDGQHQVAILSYGLWQRRFGGDAHVVGRTITVDGKPTAIVGVMPAVLERTFDGRLWLPADMHAPGMETNRHEHAYYAIGRLRPGVTLARARAALGPISAQLAAAYPLDHGTHLYIQPYRDVVVGHAAPVLAVLLGAVGLVLLIACANVASLMLARGTARESEIAVRTALGASRSVLVRGLMTESLLLGAAAGGAGLVLAYLLVRGVRAVAGGMLPRAAEVHIDGRALLFTLGITLLTTLAFGLAPALHAARRSLATAMRTMGRSSGSRRSLRVRDALVVGQVALSLVLLAGAGLLLRSLSRVRQVDPGFDASHLLTAQIPLPAARYATRESADLFWTQLLQRVRALPGVTAAAGTGHLPLRGVGDAMYYEEGHPPLSLADARLAELNVVTDGYFHAMRIPIITGRPLGETERRMDGVPAAGTDSVKGDEVEGAVVISRHIAQELFPHQNPLGRRLVIGSQHAEVVGVAGDVHGRGQAVAADDMLYLSLHQRRSFLPLSLVVRARGDASALAPAIRNVLHQLDPTVPLAEVTTMDGLLHDSLADTYFRTQLLGGFAFMALVLAVVGLYGVLAYTVRQRAREIGVRMALGARSTAIVSSVVRRGMLLVGTGIALGLAGALAVTRLIGGLLFDVGSTDPVVLAAVTATLLVAGLAACTVPAWRAMRIDPVIALREE